MTRITITISDEEKNALRSLSEKEFRDPRMQAALILRMGLESRGVLQPMSPVANIAPVEVRARKIKQIESTAKRGGNPKF